MKFQIKVIFLDGRDPIVRNIEAFNWVEAYKAVTKAITNNPEFSGAYLKEIMRFEDDIITLEQRVQRELIKLPLFNELSNPKKTAIIDSIVDIIKS